MIVDSIISGAVFLIEELGIFAVGATVIGWVAKDMIGQYFEKELNKYQAEIDKELSKYQAELDKEKLRYSQLHTDRAQVTAELYEKLVQFELDMIELTDPVELGDRPPKRELLMSAKESGNEFLRYYRRNQIYFPEDVCKTVDEVYEEMKSIFHEFMIYKPHESEPGDPQDPEHWLELWERVSDDEVPELKKELEDHFRELLGVDTEQQNG
ncbi:hypothetical protein [Haloarcula sebkhae]|uniref:Uncharacterized protein n=2 Tax=Haloarcula sebkhae TaxID=932660 RepID=A0ACC6VLV0_9EURY|nr:hypothetical protein [Haloarcula sebkhae]GGK81923.1 hypothetical protein GCM10009067_37720 [Haloarcula sebkhae]